MGNIYLQLINTPITLENIDLVNYTSATGRDLSALLSKSTLRKHLISHPMTRRMQELSIDNTNFTLEELDTIFEVNKDSLINLWVHHNRSLPIEFINKHAHALNLRYIHVQENLDIAFIEKYKDVIRLQDVIENVIQRHGIQYIQPLLHDPKIQELAMRQLTWKTTKDELKEFLKYIPAYSDNMLTDEFIDEIYSTEISMANLQYLYDNFGGGYSSGDIVGFYNSHYNTTEPEKLLTYEEFVQIALSKRENTLPPILWNDHIRRMLLK